MRVKKILKYCRMKAPLAAFLTKQHEERQNAIMEHTTFVHALSAKLGVTFSMRAPLDTFDRMKLAIHTLLHKKGVSEEEEMKLLLSFYREKKHYTVYNKLFKMLGWDTIFDPEISKPIMIRRFQRMFHEKEYFANKLRRSQRSNRDNLATISEEKSRTSSSPKQAPTKHTRTQAVKVLPVPKPIGYTPKTAVTGTRSYAKLHASDAPLRRTTKKQ